MTLVTMMILSRTSAGINVAFHERDEHSNERLRVQPQATARNIDDLICSKIRYCRYDRPALSLCRQQRAAVPCCSFLATAQLLADGGFESLGLLDTVILVGLRSPWM